ncbi:PaaI family thioesterase [Pseudodesulfovibrio sp. zrk46]|uniref:PaaI family thioesterase n=1 Tax=Pseudodesulfovibrio sp. zrk46 TaxID=2725288 RepID=UPI001449587A|nr:PaaI family thioesterase [Pseudodesulfovibrio sp. zrk46]QJB56151.1 PaaI family thioesterase [Pseudodesulfovibrio sp. zrk46]
MSEYIENPFEDGHCFFCGPDNADGLNLKFKHDKEAGEVVCEYVPEQRFQGQGHVFHGGMQMGLLDEAMWWTGYAQTGVKEAVTINASFRFLRPVYIGEPVTIACKVKSFEKGSIKLSGAIINKDGKKCTVVRGEYRVITDQYETVIER